MAGEVLNGTQGILGHRIRHIWALFEELVKMAEQLYKFSWGN